MVNRICKLHSSHSFFLFGARGVGKSTLIEQKFDPSSSQTLWVDLLLHEHEEPLAHNPDHLLHMVRAKNYQYVVIDEVQKIPKLLDVVQKIMHTHKNIQFVITGSSARKLKRGAANMLAGRAFEYHLFPFSIFELHPCEPSRQSIKQDQNNARLNTPAADPKKNTHKSTQLLQQKDLNNQNLWQTFQNILEYGALPSIWKINEPEDKKQALRTYVQTYLKEEVQVEQLVRQLQPFRNFLPIAAQQNGQPINHSRIANQVGVDDKTVKSYFSILEDTWLGFFLPSYHKSIRKQQRHAPKFYFFDTGITRALNKQLAAPLVPGTYAYGQNFEHRIVLEVFFLNHYLQKDFSFYYLKTKNNVEVDLIIERPGQADLFVEIKSTTRVQKSHIRSLENLQSTKTEQRGAQTAPPAHNTDITHHDLQPEYQLWSQDPRPAQLGPVKCLHWYDALQELYGISK